MPHEQLNERQVAEYLHMDIREVTKLASRGQIPCRKVGGKFIFNKGELDTWVASQIHELPKHRLAAIEKGVGRHHGFDTESLLVWPLIPAGGLAVPLNARSRDGVIRGLVEIASAAELVYGRDELLEHVLKREELCSTAMIPGVAMPHPRQPLPHDIAASFVVAGLTSSGIPYGSPDGSLTRLFFLICCKDDRTHLHVLARLAAQILHSRESVDELMSAGDADEFGRTLLRIEKQVAGEE